MLKDIKYVIEIICLENRKLFFDEFLTEANFFSTFESRISSAI